MCIKYFSSLKEDKYKRQIVLVFFLFVIFLILFTEPYLNTFNIVSRYLTIESIVEDHDFIIDDKYQATDDIIYREGHWYSSKPPILSIVTSSVYYITHNFFHQDFPEFNEINEYKYYYSLYPTVYFTSLIFVGGTFFLLLVYFYKTLKLLAVDKKYHLPLILGLGLGTLFLPYSTTLNNHTIAGSLLFMAFYYLLLIKYRAGNGPGLNRHLSIAGIFGSLATVIDLPTGLVFYGLFFIYFLFKLGFKKIFYYLWPFFIIFSIHLYFNYQAFGGLLPAQLYKDYWFGPDGMPTLAAYFPRHSWYIYIFNILFGTHGFFSYTPLLILSFFGLFKVIKAKSEFFWEASIVLFGFIFVIAFYTLLARDYGGTAYGFRWLISLTPLIYFFIIFLFKQGLSKKLSVWFNIFFIWSIFLAIIGVIDPWPMGFIITIFSDGEFLLPPVLAVLQTLVYSYGF
ncbi:MAG: hypothetical protein A2406_03500 [Candidatus Komeilibacteria bacterium RIFOXYC1_FULL_37_11]|uniref:Glycosyltransferase RgtA/B/C/D-like domain-containing protein n=1 Tax=Candidatus Komeilibacteria bacterium RIFOXYC1_FULL_37_11 TaxID=1798555 RepID=A0A1G2BXN3_9BACT|nr:MAG: hypothetical protein A2406_03500 [Candidatus Komeilibacteria bacterium RIFOXYC1_FULL_37_11]OGY95164.1 MAG: hypothetical protein A2611_00440 [Candidatus Komeilibacteria bacterium RIFOXYD1_FULL_37_29]